MNNSPTGPGTNTSASNNAVGFLFLAMFGVAFGGIGTAAVVKSVRLLAAGDTHNGVPVGVIGLFFALFGFAILSGLLWFRRKTTRDAAAALRYPGQPWMLRPDWAVGKIKSSTSAQTLMFFIMALAFLGIGGASAASLPRELSKGNRAALVVLFFPAAGVGLFVAFLRSWMQQLRTGRCLLELSRVPAPLGGKLEAALLTARLKLQHALHLQLSCIRRVANSGRNSSSSEYVLWQEEKIYRPEALFPETGPDGTSIPVYFKLPADQPESSSAGSVTTTWRLDVKSVMSGANFHALFEVPVFQLAGAEPVAPDEPDPTLALQMPVEEIRLDEHSLIQVSTEPDGRQFFFPARRNWKKAWAAAAAMVFTYGMMAAMLRTLPLVFTLFILLFAVVATLSFLDLSLGNISITIDSAEVRRVKRWLFLSSHKNYAKDQVSQLKADVNRNIALVTSAGRQVVLADGVPVLLEAEWLAREMNAALGCAALPAAAPLPSPIPLALRQMTQRAQGNPGIGLALFLIVGVIMFAPFLRALVPGNRSQAGRPPISATTSRTPPPAPARQAAAAPVEIAGLSITGTGFHIETLDLGRKAFQNRKFVWKEVPEQFRGCTYTQVRGGANPPAHIVVQSKHDTELYLLTSAHHDEVDLNGWTLTKGQFYYNDKKHVPMVLLQRKVTGGETVSIPQGNWTGCLLLIPDVP